MQWEEELLRKKVKRGDPHMLALAPCVTALREFITALGESICEEVIDCGSY